MKTSFDGECLMSRFTALSMFVTSILSFLTLLLPPTAHATLLIDPGQCGADASRCYATNGIVGATAYEPTEIFPVTTDPGYVKFKKAFDSWNPGGWSLKVDNLSAEATLTVTLYRAFVQEGQPGCIASVLCGGAEIRVSYNNGGNPPFPISGCAADGCDLGTVPAGAAVWSQSILTNQKRDPSLPGNPYLDNAPGTPDASIGPPAYPFQYNGSLLYDMPARDASASWLADAWISSIDTTTDTLTVYDGIQWGFSVPEPISGALLAAGLAGLAYVRRRTPAVSP
jgi:hypothetical protein